MKHTRLVTRKPNLAADTTVSAWITFISTVLTAAIPMFSTKKTTTTATTTTTTTT